MLVMLFVGGIMAVLIGVGFLWFEVSFGLACIMEDRKNHKKIMR